MIREGWIIEYWQGILRDIETIVFQTLDQLKEYIGPDYTNTGNRLDGGVYYFKRSKPVEKKLVIDPTAKKYPEYDRLSAVRVEVIYDEEPEIKFYRASGDVVCYSCGRQYWHHPFADERAWNGEPFLHVLCNGDLVKL